MTTPNDAVSPDMNPQSGALNGLDTVGHPSPSTTVLLKRYDLPEGPSASAAARQRRIALLTRTIQTQILPTLALAHSHDSAAASPAPLLDDAGLASFTDLVLTNDLPAGTARLELLVAGGAALTDICLSVLTPVARRLGEMWDDDLCSFVDVTTGLGMLHILMYRLRELCVPALPVRDLSRRILLAGLAGNQHTFGLEMVAEVFRNAGWDVTVATAAAEADLPGIVRETSFAIAGLSITRDRQTANLATTIRAMRLASANPAIGILLGGPVLATQPNLARLVGADVAASDARQAVLRAEGLRLLMTALEPDASCAAP